MIDKIEQKPQKVTIELKEKRGFCNGFDEERKPAVAKPDILLKLLSGIKVKGL